MNPSVPKKPFSFIREAPPISRTCSLVVTDQGTNETCFAHAVAKMMTRFIKFHFPRDFKSEGEKFSIFYDMITCTKTYTIFDCIEKFLEYYNTNREDRKKFLPGLDGEAQRDGEIMSALLFHYIYNSIFLTCSCQGDSVEKAIITALDKLTQDTDLDSIKSLLKIEVYNAKKQGFNIYAGFIEIYINYLYVTLKEVSSAIQTSLFKPIMYRSLYLENFKVMKNYWFKELGNFKEPEPLSQMKTSPNSWIIDLNTIINEKQMYAVIGFLDHAVTITRMTSTELEIKDSRKTMMVDGVFVMPQGIETPVIGTDQAQTYKLDIAKLTTYNDKMLARATATHKICIMYLDAEIDSARPLQLKIDRLSTHGFAPRAASMSELLNEQKQLTAIAIQEQQQYKENQVDQVDWDYITTPKDQHPLIAIQTQERGVYCNKCSKTLKKKEWSYHCETCDYDLCVTCAAKEVKEGSTPGYYKEGKGKWRWRTLRANKVKSQNSQTRRKKEKKKKKREKRKEKTTKKY